MRSRAFSLTELLVVLAIILLLVAIVLIGTQKVRRMANLAGDTNHQRQIALAMTSYSTDNNGGLPSPRTSAGSDAGGAWTFTLNPGGNCGGPFTVSINASVMSNAKYHTWTASYGDNIANGAGGQYEVEFGVNSFTNPNGRALSEGRLWNYIGDAKVYKSPLDPSTRLRSYSLNAFVGVTVPTDSDGFNVTWDDWFCYRGVPMSALNTTKIARIPQPARTMASVVEDDNDGFSFNNEGWVIDPRYPGTPQATSFGGWIDWPAMWDPTAIPFSYMDGSTDVYAVVRQTLPDEIETYGHWYVPPNDANGIKNDWLYFRDRLLPGIVPEGPATSVGY